MIMHDSSSSFLLGCVHSGAFAKLSPLYPLSGVGILGKEADPRRDRGFLKDHVSNCAMKSVCEETQNDATKTIYISSQQLFTAEVLVGIVDQAQPRIDLWS